MTIERANTRPLPGPDHVVPRQKLKSESSATGQLRHAPDSRSTHYASARTISEWDGLRVPANRRSDAYGQTFGAGAKDNDDVRGRVGNGHAELIRLLGTGPESSRARRVHDRRFDHMGEAATAGNAIHGNLHRIWKSGSNTKLAVTWGFQAWSMSGPVADRVTLRLSADIEPMVGGAAVKTVPVARVPIPSFGDWPPLVALGAGQVFKQGFNAVHDYVQPKYLTGIAARRAALDVQAEAFRANAREASEIRAGSAGAGIVKAFGEGGRDHLEDAMNEADRSMYDYMKAMQRQTRWATEPEQHLVETGVDAAATQATLARLAEADFLTRFAGRGKEARPVVYYWQPPELPAAGFVSAATDPTTATMPAGARARQDVSAAERPPRWDYRPDSGALLAEAGRALGQIPSWGDYGLAQANLLLARSGRPAAWVQLGKMCEEGRLGMAQGAISRRTAEQLYEGPARQGDAQAQYRLGLMHAEGHADGPRNDRLAVEWLQKAATQGHAGARAELGLMHAANRTGLDPEASGTQAVQWLREAVRGGVQSPQVMFTLGLMHEKRLGDAGLDDEASRNAEKWYLEAARLGHGKAFLRLGLLHYHGTPGLRGGTGNDADAAKYLGMAKDRGDAEVAAEAAYHLGLMYRGRRAVPEGETSLDDALRACLEQAADGGCLPAQVLLGRMLAAGELEPLDGWAAGQAAARRLLQAAGRGDADAQCELANLYRTRKAQPEEGQHGDAAAMHWYRQAAERGSARAWLALAEMHEAGSAGLPQGPEANRKMAECLAQGAALGDRVLQFQLAEHYRKGTPGLETGARADAQAARWYARAAAQGHAESAYRLGQFHRDGRAWPEGAEPKSEAAWNEAGRLFEAAAREGHVHAGFELGELLLNKLGKTGKGDGDPAATVRKAFKHMKQAAKQGDPDLQYRLAGWHVRRKPDTPEASQERDGEALAWLQKAAKQGHLQALQRLADLHIEGRTGMSKEKADRTARGVLRRAVELGDSASLARLGWMYEVGRGGMATREESEIQAVTHYTDAVHRDDSPVLAMRRLAVMSIEGRGGIKKGSIDREAVQLLELAAERDDGLSMHLLGRLHAQGGCGLAKDVAPDGKAVHWLTKAAERGVKQARADLEALQAGRDLSA